MADQLIQDLQTLRRRNRVQPHEAVRYLVAAPADFDTLADLAGATPTRFTFARMLRTALSPTARDELPRYLLFDPGYLQASAEAGRRRAQETGLPGHGEQIDWST